MGADPNELAGAARFVLQLAKFDGSEEYIPIGAVFRALGFEIKGAPPPGTRGQLEIEDLIVRIAFSFPTENTRTLSHEGGHLGQILCKLPLDESDATEIGRQIVLPPSLCKALVRHRGFNAHALVRLAPDLPPAWVLGRVAEETGAVVVIEYKRQRTVFGTPTAVVPARRTAWEERLVERARASNARVAFGHRGIAAWVIGSGPGAWTAVYVPPEALDMVAQVSRQVPGVLPFFGEPANDDG